MGDGFAAAANPTTIRPPATLSAASQTPLSDDARDILAGISVMVLAIANRQNLADQEHMREQEEELLPCGDQRVTVRSASAKKATRVATSTGPSTGW